MQIEMIFVFGHLEINKEVLQILASYQICVQFFSYTGRYIGEFLPEVNRIGNVAIQQVKLQDCDEKKNKIAKEIILSSMHNTLELLKYYARKGRRIKEEIHKIEKLKVELEKKEIKQITDILLIEAKMKNIYYSTFNTIIINKGFTFHGRSLNPPLDEMNALMSYGYAILYGILDSIIHRSNLLNQIPVIHGTSRKDNLLAYDIADIFKPICIDRVIFRVINKNQVNLSHFKNTKKGCFLDKVGASLFIGEIEQKLSSTYYYNNKSRTYRSILGLEIHNFEKAILDLKDYKGFKEHI